MTVLLDDEGVELIRELEEALAAARETNRKLHRRVQYAEGPLLRRAQKAETSAAFWLERRKHYGREAASLRRRLAKMQNAGLEQHAAQAIKDGPDAPLTGGSIEARLRYALQIIAGGDGDAQVIAQQTLDGEDEADALDS